jgi:hypothetical protein
VPPKIDLDQHQEAELLRLQRLTAQRADQLAAGGRAPSPGDLAIWLQAEEEILAGARLSLVAAG